MTRLLRLLVVFLVSSLPVVVVGAQSAGADSAPASSDGVPAEALGVAVDLHRVELKLLPVQSQLRAAQVQLQTTQAAVDETTALLATQQQRRSSVQNRVRRRAAIAYTRSGLRMNAVLSVPNVREMSSAQEYVQGATNVDTDDLTAIDKLINALQDELQQRVSARDAAQSDNQRLAQTAQDLAARQSSDQQRLQAWNAIPVMGDAWLTASEMAAWYASTGAVPKLAPGTTVRDLAQMYLDEGADEGVRGDLAFAQSIVETASFSVAAGNNYSGIGVCDSCTGGYSFPTPRDGVRAQIQLLRNYADPDSRAANLDHPPSPSLYGRDSQRAAKLYDTFFLKGKAPIWNVMGNGNWATSTTYARSVVTMYAQMLDFAKAHPS